jgi:hypothetical protein
MMNIFIFLLPWSEFFYISCFAMASICNTIYLVKNILAYHDLDKLTGTALHVFPLLTMWNIHWNLAGTDERTRWGFYETQNIEFSLDFAIAYFSYFLIFYICWAIPHYTLLHLYWEKIISNNWYCLMLNELVRGAFVKDIRKNYGTAAGKVAYAVKHLIYILVMTITLLPAFFSKIYCTCILLIYVYILFNRGGAYYIDHFSRKYEENLKLLDKLGKKYDPLKMRPEENSFIEIINS